MKKLLIIIVLIFLIQTTFAESRKNLTSASLSVTIIFPEYMIKENQPISMFPPSPPSPPSLLPHYPLPDIEIVDFHYNNKSIILKIKNRENKNLTFSLKYQIFDKNNGSLIKNKEYDDIKIISNQQLKISLPFRNKSNFILILGIYENNNLIKNLSLNI